MDRITPVNSSFLQALAPFSSNSSIKLLVENTISTSIDSLSSIENWPILAFYIKATEDLFSLYVVTPGKFLLGEMNLEGRMLNIALPIERVKRLTLEIDLKSVLFFIELDADAKVYRKIFENEVELGLRELPSGYEITAPNEDSASLINFSNAFKSIIGL